MPRGVGASLLANLTVREQARSYSNKGACFEFNVSLH
jgi:hypothetical protein